MEADARIRLSQRLRELRKKYRFTQQQLAELADLDYKHIQLLESPHPPYARLDTLGKLAKAFGISVSALLER